MKNDFIYKYSIQDKSTTLSDSTITNPSGSINFHGKFKVSDIENQNNSDDKFDIHLTAQDRQTEKNLDSVKVLPKSHQMAEQRGAINHNTSPMPWTGKEPKFKIAKNGAFFGIDEIHPKDLVHTLAVGGTGSGKTISNLIPLLKAQLRYELPSHTGNKRSSILVIDPKHELLDIVSNTLAQQGESDRLIIVGTNCGKHIYPVQFFYAGDSLSNRERLAKIDLIFGTSDLAEGGHSYWHNSAMQVLERFMNLEEAYRSSQHESLVLRWLQKFSPSTTAKMPPVDYWPTLLELLDRSRQSRSAFKAINVSLKELLKIAELQDHPDAAVMDTFQDEMDLMQWQYRMQSADPVIRLLADPEVARLVNMNPFPNIDVNLKNKSLNLRDAMNAGKVVIFQPTGEANSALAARAIKTSWYSAVQNRSDMSRPVGLVVDEFQRFITIDEASGDANFLDVARGYRCNSVLATQSIEALLNTLKSSRHAESAIASIVANTPSKFFFATKDRKTEEIMRSLIPSPPGSDPHIVCARPPALLKPGEAYWSLANGQWGRGRVKIENLS